MPRCIHASTKSRSLDFLYEPIYYVPGPRAQHLEIEAGIIRTGSEHPFPVMDELFSGEKCPTVLTIPPLPSHAPKGAFGTSNEEGIHTVCVTGRDRAKFFHPSVNPQNCSLAQEVNKFLPRNPSPYQFSEKRSSAAQTLFREEEAQTTPWSPPLKSSSGFEVLADLKTGESLPVRSQDDLQVVRRLWEHRSSGTTGDGNFVVKQENLRSKKRLRLRETERAMAQRRFVVSHRQATLLRAITGRIKMEQERKVAAIEKRWYKKKIFMNWSEQRRRRKKWLSEDAGAASGLSMESVPRPLLSHGVCPRVLPAAKQPEKNEVSAKDDQEHSVVVSLENQSSDLRSEIDKEADRILNVVLEKVCGLSLSEGGAKSTAF